MRVRGIRPGREARRSRTSPPGRGVGTRGFTIVEVIAVLCLVAVICGIVAVNFTAVINAVSERPVEDVLRRAVREARVQAAKTRKAAYLSFDKTRAAFLVSTETGEELAVVETGRAGGEDSKLEVKFLPVLPETGLAGKPEFKASEVPLPRVRFDPSGVAPPLRVSIRTANEETSVSLEPFSAARLENGPVT